MSFLDRAKQVAGVASTKAKEGLEEVHVLRDLDQAYEELGKTTFTLADAGEITHPQLAASVDRIRALQAKLADQPSRSSDSTGHARGADEDA
jgi:hypothetical protein